jgi:hypothetical protein
MTIWKSAGESSMTGYTQPELTWSMSMRVMIASVILNVPNAMTESNVIEELYVSIAFGNPKIVIQYVGEDDSGPAV